MIFQDLNLSFITKIIISMVKQKFPAQALLMPYLKCTTKVTPV
jgi:hypothetical protein